MRHNQPPCGRLLPSPLLLLSSAMCSRRVPSFVRTFGTYASSANAHSHAGHSVQKYTQHHHVPPRRVENREVLAVFVVPAQNGAAIVHSTGWLASLRVPCIPKTRRNIYGRLRGQLTESKNTPGSRRRRNEDSRSKTMNSRTFESFLNFCIFSLTR